MVEESDDIWVRLIALRAVVAHLLAYEAARSSDPDSLYRQIAENVEGLIARHSHGRPVMDLEEGVRKEIDWFVAARSI